MVIGVLKEHSPETRVVILPEHIAALKKLNAEVWVEKSAGAAAFALDTAYSDAGASLGTREEVLASADIIFCINLLSESDAQRASGKILIGVFQPLLAPRTMKEYASKNISVFSLDMLPRTTRAQSMDVLSSQANIAGYKAVLLASNIYPRYFPMFMTAAGSIPPARILILGAGVAGLQAIATARRLGAVVEVFDTRPAVKEEVQSLGAKFIEVEGAADASQAGGYAVEQSEEFLQRQKEKIAESAAKADIIITTAQIPGKKAPVLITEEIIGKMKAGSVIIDLAAATGGNTPLTRNDETIVSNGVIIVGDSRLPSSMPADASKLIGKNFINFLQLLVNKEGNVHLNFEDDLVRGCCIAYNGDILNDRVSNLLSGTTIS